MAGPAPGALQKEDLEGNSPTAAETKLAGSSEDEMEQYTTEAPPASDVAPPHELEHAPRLFRHSVELIEEVGAGCEMPAQRCPSSCSSGRSCTCLPSPCCLPLLWLLWRPCARRSPTSSHLIVSAEGRGNGAEEAGARARTDACQAAQGDRRHHSGPVTPAACTVPARTQPLALPACCSRCCATAGCWPSWRRLSRSS